MSMGETLSAQLAAKVAEVKDSVAGVSDEAASRPATDGGWCAKQILSHLCGDDDALSMYEFRRFLDEDTPDLGINPGEHSEVRRGAPVSELVSKIESDYSAIGSFFAGLSDDQLSRKAHVPFLKETPLGEYPTLGQWAGAMINYHLADHVNQLRSLSG